MTGSDLAERLARKGRMSLGQADLIVGVILDCLKDSLRRGERIELRGLGTFRVRRYQGYTGRNPRSGESIEVKPKRLPYFKPSVALLWKMNRRLRDSPAKRTVTASEPGPSLSESLGELSGPYDVA